MTINKLKFNFLFTFLRAHMSSLIISCCPSAPHVSACHHAQIIWQDFYPVCNTYKTSSSQGSGWSGPFDYAQRLHMTNNQQKNLSNFPFL